MDQDWLAIRARFDQGGQKRKATLIPVAFFELTLDYTA